MSSNIATRSQASRPLLSEVSHHMDHPEALVGERKDQVMTDFDPLDDMCDACGAPVAQDCAPGCGTGQQPE